jgi:hypothetical protein
MIPYALQGIKTEWKELKHDVLVTGGTLGFEVSRATARIDSGSFPDLFSQPDHWHQAVIYIIKSECDWTSRVLALSRQALSGHCRPFQAV